MSTDFALLAIVVDCPTHQILNSHGQTEVKSAGILQIQGSLVKIN